MTTVQIRRNENGISGIRVSGHSGYASSGSDIVCAAASVLITTCANALETAAGLTPVLKVEKRTAVIDVSLPENLSPAQMHDGQIVFQTILQGFSDIAAEYPRYLQIV